MRKTTLKRKTTEKSTEPPHRPGTPPIDPPRRIPKPKNTPVPQEVPVKKRPLKKTPQKRQQEWSAMTFLLTFPQWEGNDTKEKLLEKLINFWKLKKKTVKEAIICIEDHGVEEGSKGHEDGQDPGRHIHMCFKLDKKHCIKNPDFFDLLVGKHGNIQTCRDYKACQIYCNKDGNVITHNVDIEAVIESTRTKKGVKHETVVNFIKKGLEEGVVPTLKEVDEKFGAYVIQHETKVQSYIKLQHRFLSEKTTPYHGIDMAKVLMESANNPQLVDVVSWLNKNLPPQQRPHKQKQLWLYGPAGVGKTRLQSQLSEYFAAYHVANEDKWWSGMDDSVEIIMFDEFTGYKTLSDMKRLLEGSRFPMPQKGQQPFIKIKNIPIIICSNSSPEQVYHNVLEKSPQEFQPLLERLQVIELTKDTQIPFLEPPIQGEESPDEEEKDEVEVLDEIVLGTPPRQLKRNKKTLEQIRQELMADEVLEMDSRSSGQEEDEQEQIEDPYEQIEDQDPYNPEDHSEISQEARINKLRKINKKYN